MFGVVALNGSGAQGATLLSAPSLPLFEIAGRLRQRAGGALLGWNPVVTGRKNSLQGSGGKRFGKKIVGAGVVTLC